MPFKEKIKSLAQDIRFWIGFFFLVRLFGISNAPLESSHNWRQSLTNMITRNFYENGVDLLHPVIDIAGERTGIIGSEFPLFNYLTYLFSELIGYHHWNGRLINLIVSSIGLYFFYKLVKSVVNEKVAFYSTLILTSSIWFIFSRKIMPDTFSVSLVIIGLYFASIYLQKGKFLHLLLFGVLATAGILCKIPALSLLSVLLIVLFIRSIPLKRKALLFITASLAFSVMCLWYFYWIPYLLETYHYQLFFSKSIPEGIAELLPLIPETLERFYFSGLHSFIGFAAFLAGCYFLVKKKEKWLLLSCGIMFIIFCFFIIKTGAVFAQHSYYIIPFVPFMALIAGYFLAVLPPKYAGVLVALIMLEAIGNQNDDFFVKDSEKYKLTLEQVMDNTVPLNEKIVINGGASPQLMYFAHRKGWTIDSELLVDTDVVDSLSQLGAFYLVVNKDYWPHNVNRPHKIFEDGHFSVYKLVE